MPDGSFWATVIAATFALAAAVYAGRSARKNRREQEENSSRSPEPPTTQQVWDRLARVELVVAAAVSMLRDVADQWGTDRPPPVFQDRDLRMLEDTGNLPPQWRRRTREKNIRKRAASE